MKRLLILFVALSAAVIISCSKDDNAKPAIIGVWKWESVKTPDGKLEDAYDEAYLEILEDKTFNEITLVREDEEIYVSNYVTGKYTYQDNKLSVTESLFGGLNVGDVKIVDNNTIELYITEGDGEGYTIIIKRSAEKLAPYIELYNSYEK